MFMGNTHKLGLITKWATCPQMWVFPFQWVSSRYTHGSGWVLGK